MPPLSQKVKDKLNKTIDFVDDIAEPGGRHSLFSKERREAESEHYDSFLEFCFRIHPLLLLLGIIAALGLAILILALSISMV